MRMLFPLREKMFDNSRVKVFHSYYHSFRVAARKTKPDQYRVTNTTPINTLQLKTIMAPCTYLCIADHKFRFPRKLVWVNFYWNLDLEAKLTMTKSKRERRWQT